MTVSRHERTIVLEQPGGEPAPMRRVAWDLRAYLTDPDGMVRSDGPILEEQLLEWVDALEAEGTSDRLDRVLHELTRLVERERRNPVLNYNLGALLYTTYGRTALERAVDHFTIAYSSAVEWSEEPEGVLGHASRPTIITGLALTGLALCYGQLAHRFGEPTAERLVNCRVTAERAVEIMLALHAERDDTVTRVALLRARYAHAFSLHITEQHEDVERAIEVYREVISGWEETGLGVPAVILNNLGYQYMDLAGRWERGSRTDLYHEALHLFRRAREVDPDFYMASANEGNIHRLFKQFEEAVAAYETALRTAGEQRRNYPAGHSELARVLLEMGCHDLAVEHHAAALRSCESDAERARYLGEWAAALFAAGLNSEAMAAAAAARELHEDELRSIEVQLGVDERRRRQAEETPGGGDAEPT